MMGPYRFGQAIDLIFTNPKLVMMRKGWYGIQQRRKMYIRFIAGNFDIKDTFISDGIFLFNNGSKTYQWNPSSLDMMSSDWMLLEVDA